MSIFMIFELDVASPPFAVLCLCMHAVNSSDIFSVGDHLLCIEIQVLVFHALVTKMMK